MTPQTKKIVTISAVAIVAPIVFFTAGTIFGVIFTGIGLAIFGAVMTRPAGRRVMGEKCAACGVLVTLEHEAEICAQCGAGIHARCLGDHNKKVHTEGAATPPYR